jgi:hypothetical protein
MLGGMPGGVIPGQTGCLDAHPATTAHLGVDPHIRCEGGPDAHGGEPKFIDCGENCDGGPDAHGGPDALSQMLILLVANELKKHL